MGPLVPVESVAKRRPRVKGVPLRGMRREGLRVDGNCVGASTRPPVGLSAAGQRDKGRACGRGAWIAAKLDQVRPSF